MRFGATIDLTLIGESSEADGWLGRVARWATGKPEFVRDHMEGAAQLHALYRMLESIGVTNARVLIVDGVLVFEDTNDRPDDLTDLIRAFADHVSLFGPDCRDVRVRVEHVEADMVHELEMRLTPEHRKDEPSARISIMSRPAGLEVQPGESAEAYRKRIEPWATEPTAVRVLELQCEGFVTRLTRELLRIYPAASCQSSLHRLGHATWLEDTSAFARTEDTHTNANTNAFARTEDTPTEASPVRAAAPTEDTAAPARNFTISVEQKIAALVAGPPPYAVRRRRIEDLEEKIVSELARRPEVQSIPVHLVRLLEQMNRLIGDHNKYYPVEANLPMNAATGEFMDRGEPWRPLGQASIDELAQRARRR